MILFSFVLLVVGVIFIASMFVALRYLYRRRLKGEESLWSSARIIREHREEEERWRRRAAMRQR